MVQFFTADKAANVLQNRQLLKSFIQQIFTYYKRDLVYVNYIFCSDEYLLQINRDHLNHDYYTDIITFNLSLDKKVIEGEIYVSVERVKENAALNNTTFKHELHRVVFHGALHLCGFKDKTKKEEVLMRNTEDYWLTLYFS
jgi:probable rRNA maturation factor